MSDHILSPAHPSPLEALETARTRRFQEHLGEKDIRRAALEFESYFLSYLMKTMRSTVPKGHLTANPMGETFYSFYDDEIAKRAAQSGGLGLAEFILSSLAEASSHTSDRPA